MKEEFSVKAEKIIDVNEKENFFLLKARFPKEIGELKIFSI